MAAGGANALLADLLFRLGRARVLIGVTAAGAAAVELDALTGTGDAVAFTAADAGGAGHARWAGGGAARAAGGEGWAVGVGIGVILGVGVVNGGVGETVGELLKSGLGVVSLDEVGGLAGALGLWGADELGGERAALGNVTGVAAGSTLA